MPLAGSAQPFDPFTVNLDSMQNWVDTRLQNVSEDSISYFICHLGLQRAKEEDNPEALARAYFQLAEWHNYHFYSFGKRDSAIYYDQMSIDAYKQIGDDNMVALSYYYLGLDSENIGRLPEAERATLEALRRYEALGDRKWMGYAYETLCLIYTELKDAAKAIHYGELGLEILEQEIDEVEIALTYAELTQAYLLTDRLDKIEEYATKSILGFEAGYPDYHAAFEYYRSYEARAFVHMERGDYELALADLQFALDTASRYLGDSLIQDFQLNIGRVHNAQRSYSKALEHLQKASDFMTQYGMETPVLHQEMAKSYEGIGDLTKALFHQKRTNELQNEINEERIRTMETELLAKYEADQKDATIAAQDRALNQQQRIQWLVGGIAALLLIILILLYGIYRNNQLKNARLSGLNIELIEKNRQNELLVKEIHHRVKNNLETVSGLLELQSLRLSDQEAQDALLASQTRVESMGIIHRKLYQGTRTSRVEMKDYFRDLGTSLTHAYQALDRVEIAVDMDPVDLDIDEAIPIGLIVNELLTNAMKYAFPEERSGEVTIGLVETSPHQLHLQVADNGIGKKSNGDVAGTGFGSQLIQILAKQLNGKVEERNDQGTHYDFYFDLSDS